MCIRDSGNGASRLREYVAQSTQRKVGAYAVTEDFQIEPRRWDFGNRHFREGVETVVRPHLATTADCHLDPEPTRRCLNFWPRSWDRDTGEWIPTSPALLVSRSTCWAYGASEHPCKELIETAFAERRRAKDLDRTAQTYLRPRQCPGKAPSSGRVNARVEVLLRLKKRL